MANSASTDVAATQSNARDRYEQVMALAGIYSQSAIQQLIEFLADEDPLVRWQAGEVLAQDAAFLQSRARLGMPAWGRQSPEMTFSSLLMTLSQGLQDPSPLRRAATADALSFWDHERVVTFLLRALDDEDAQVRASVAAALGRIGDKTAVDALADKLTDPSVWVRKAAIDALGAIGDPQSVAALEQALSQKDTLVREAAVCALGHMATPKARQILEECTEDQEATVRWYAARGLGKIGGIATSVILNRLLDDSYEMFGKTIAQVAQESIERIQRRERAWWHWLQCLWRRLRLRLQRLRRSKE